MEYDTDRAGGFEPLRFVPKNKTVVLGLVTTKTGTLEKKDEIKRRIEQAAKFVDIDQLCLSPQCGFASTEEGNALAEERGMGEAAHDRRDRRRGVGLGTLTVIVRGGGRSSNRSGGRMITGWPAFAGHDNNAGVK